MGLVLEQSYIAFFATVIFCVFYLTVSWGVVRTDWLLAWFVAMMVLTVFRFWANWRAQKNLAAANHAKINRIARVIHLGAAAAALLWAVMSTVFLRADSPEHFISTILLLAGLCTGVVSSYIVDRRFTYIYLTMMLLPFAARMAWEGRHFFALLIGCFLALMILLGRNVNRYVVKSVELGVENEELIHKINDASHEIRTPVTAIVGFAEILKDSEEAPEDIRNYAEVIHRNSEYLKKLVDSVLLMAESDSDEEPEVPQETVNFRDQVQCAAAVLSQKIEEKNLQLEIKVEPNVPELIKSNSLKFQQILVNLLSNAVKFTPRGKISIHAGCCNDLLLIKVADTGIGIKPEAKDSLFRPFWRENRKEVRSQQGSGLGLALSRSLTRSLGGDLILLESHPGRGTTFEVQLPLYTHVRTTMPEQAKSETNS